MVRPFALVGGRTDAAPDLNVESLLVTTTAGADALAQQTSTVRQMLDLCREARSVAEVAAVLHVPLAVAKVMASDARAGGLVEIHRDAPVTSTSFLEEVLDAFRSL